MSYGFSTSNTSNEIVIDQNFRNFEVIQSGTVVGSNGAYTVNYPTTEFALAFFEVGQNQQFCFGPTTTTQARWFAQRLSCRYVICAPRANGDAGTEPGVAIFDASSRCVFSSNRDYIKIDEARNLPGPTQHLQTYSASHLAAPFDSLVCGAYLGVWNAFCSQVLFRSFKRTSTTNIEVGTFAQFPFPSPFHLLGDNRADWGPGGGSDGYGYPIIFGR